MYKPPRVLFDFESIKTLVRNHKRPSELMVVGPDTNNNTCEIKVGRKVRCFSLSSSWYWVLYEVFWTNFLN